MSLPKDDAIPVAIGEPGGGMASPIAGATTIRKPDPRRQYIVGGRVRGQDDPMALPESIDDLTRTYGFSAYDALMAVPSVAASVNVLKLGIMTGDLQITETHPAKFYMKTLTPEQQTSKDVRDFCERLLNRVPGFRQAMLQLLDAVIYGNKLAELSADVATDGPDKGKLVLTQVVVKNRKSWLFVVNQANKVVGILSRSTSEMGYQILPPEKFIWLTWWPHNSDPRGSTVLRPAYAPANLSVQLYAQYYKYLRQFASPSLVAKPDPNSEPVADPDTGDILTPEMILLQQLELFENGVALVVPAGADVQPIAVQGNGEAFTNAFRFMKEEVVVSILGQTRATMEAQHGSKADSEQGDEILGLPILYGKETIADAIREHILKYFVAVNFGQEVADQFTPYVYPGARNPKNTVALWNGLANAYKSGAVTKSVQQEWHARADAPIPDQEIDQKAADEEMKRQQEAIQDAPGKPQDGQGEDFGIVTEESYVPPGGFARRGIRGLFNRRTQGVTSGR